MCRKLWLAPVLALAVAMPASADEYDFVGYKYSQDYKRDYDRGFFFGAEAWAANVRNLHFAPILMGSDATTGGELLEVETDHQLSGRYFVGYRANRRIGTFTLSYWDFDTDVADSGAGFGFTSTDAHPVHSDLGKYSAFEAFADVTMEYGEAEWKQDFGQGRKFTGWFSVALQMWELTYQTDTFLHSGGPTAVHIGEFSSTEGFGGRVGVGGRYQFTDRFSMGAGMKVGYSAAHVDAFFYDQPGADSFGDAFDPDHFIARNDADIGVLNYEGDLNFHLRAAGGFEIDWGYRYHLFDDAVAHDRFTSGTGAAAVAVDHALNEIGFDGPYVNVRYAIGLSKIDSDGDTVLDVYDDCPDTPAGAWVDEKGCPRDLDEDGVYDGIDRCPGTPFGSRVDEFGCSIDSDGDTVADGLDLCPNTPACARVDTKGCPRDTDGDGVPDGCDACPASASGASVDAQGCSVITDSDGDTVPDSRDRCPNTARGAKVDEFGCEQVVDMILHFETDSARINPSDYDLLNRIAEALVADGGNFEVAGHADARATVEYNQDLSERRANAVRDYLINRGVAGSNLSAVGYSENVPIASNETEEGMALNRRVEVVRR